MMTNQCCSICGLPYVTHLRDVGTSRTKKVVPLFYCMSCQSFSCPSGFKYDTATFTSDVLYHTNGMKEKEPYLSRFASDLLKFIGGVRSYADVGCGVGHLVSLFKRYVKVAHGYDISVPAIAEGRKIFPDLVLSEESFMDAPMAYELVTAIDTFEHIDAPITFLLGIKNRVTPKGYVYISVPRLNKDKWTWLFESVEDQQNFPPDSPFHDCDMHVSHYSDAGLRGLAEATGMAVVKDFNDYWPLNGILLRNG